MAGGVALAVDTRTAYVAAFVLAGLLSAFAAWNGTRLDHLPAYRRAPGEPRLGVLRDLPFVTVAVSTSLFSLHFVAAELGLALFISQSTLAPQVMVAVLMLVNTVAVATFQVRLSRSADSVTTGGRALIRGGLLIAMGFALFGLAEGSSATVAVVVLLAGAGIHVVGEMIGSGGQWALQMGLAPHERQGQYQGFASLGFALMNVIGPPLVTLLCVHGGRVGWLVMGAIVLASGIAAQLLARWALANRAAYGVTTHSG